MLVRKYLPNKEKRDKKTNNKNYNWCKWHTAWVEYDSEGKVAN